MLSALIVCYHSLITLTCVRSKVSLQEPRAGEQFATDATSVAQLVGEQVHRQGGHTDVRFAASVAFFGRLRVETAVRLLVSATVNRGEIFNRKFSQNVDSNLKNEKFENPPKIENSKKQKKLTRGQTLIRSQIKSQFTRQNRISVGQNQKFIEEQKKINFQSNIMFGMSKVKF